MSMVEKRERAERLERLASDPRISLSEAQLLDREASRLRESGEHRTVRFGMIVPLPRN
jgi:hypothetical protein